MDLEGIRAFMAASQEIQFEGRNRKEVYEWVRQIAVEQQYHVQGRVEGCCAATSPRRQA